MRITKDMWMSMNHLGVETFYNFFDINISFFLPILECNNTCKVYLLIPLSYANHLHYQWLQIIQTFLLKDTVLMSREFVLYPTDTLFHYQRVNQ